MRYLKFNRTIEFLNVLKNKMQKKTIKDISYENFGSKSIDYGLGALYKNLESVLIHGNFLNKVFISKSKMQQAILLYQCNSYFMGIHSQVTRAILDDLNKDEVLENIKKILEEKVLGDEDILGNLEAIQVIRPNLFEKVIETAPKWLQPKLDR